jgi:tetratricopeptide (TPR) repeat protein
MANFEKAVECQLKSLELRKSTGSERIFNNYIKLAMLHEQIGDIDKEDEFLAMAKEEMHKLDSITPRNKALFYNQLGDIYHQRGLNDSSIVCYRKVIHFSIQIGWKRGISSGLGSLAEVHYEEGALDSSIYYHKQSLKLAEEISDGIGTTEEYRHLAKLYFELGRHDSVLFYANKALQNAEDFDMLEEQSDVLKFMADFHQSQGEFEEAFALLQRHHIALDSISSAEVKKNVAELDARYETKVKEQQIELLTAENEIKHQNMRIAWLFIGFLLVLVALGLALLYFRRRQAAFKQSDLQQKLLRSQMNPHFIFNVMGSIQSYLYKNEAKKAADYLSRFASLSRSVLEFSTQESVTLKEEIDMLQNYIELERAGFEKPFEVAFTMDQEMEIDFIRVPPMLLQPFVENAIKHGLRNLAYRGKLSLSFKEIDDYIAVEILDNGRGLSDTEDHKHKSRAIEIFQQRKKGIEHTFKKELTFELQNLNTTDKSKQGVRVYLHLPILNND